MDITEKYEILKRKSSEVATNLLKGRRARKKEQNLKKYHFIEYTKEHDDGEGNAIYFMITIFLLHAP